MSDAIYVYTKKKLAEALERCKWMDRVGVLFSKSIMPQIYDSIDSTQNTMYEIDDFLTKAEAELNDD